MARLDCAQNNSILELHKPTGALRALAPRLGRHVVLLFGSSPRPPVDSASGRAGLAARPLPRTGQVTEKKARV